jgi:hypothetical protein
MSVRHRSTERGTILVLWMALKGLFFGATMLVLSIQPLTSGVGAVADAGGLGRPIKGRKEVATIGAASAVSPDAMAWAQGGWRYPKGVITYPFGYADR